VRYFEAIGPLLLLVPVAVGPLRTALVLIFWSFHLGLFAFFELGLFPFVCIAAWCALLPGAFWDRLGVSAGPGLSVRRKQWPALVCLGLVLVSNLSTLRRDTPISPVFGMPLRLAGLYQRWGMFAPNPSRGVGWMVVVGRRADGGEEDLLHEGPVSWAKPAELSSLYPSWRWATYMGALLHRRPSTRHAYADWVCRRENAGRNGVAEIESVTLYLAREARPSTGETAQIGRVQLWQETCAPSEPKPS
jgi:hypothetical protein